MRAIEDVHVHTLYFDCSADFHLLKFCSVVKCVLRTYMRCTTCIRLKVIEYISIACLDKMTSLAFRTEN